MGNCCSSSQSPPDENTENNPKNTVTPPRPSQAPVDRLPRTQTSISMNTYVALYAYEARDNEELSFWEGDIFEVLEKNDDWWYVQNKNKQKGYIPGSYVAPIQSIESEPWYFKNLTRAQADQKLLREGNEHGAFLIRDSDTKPGQYALSVRDHETVKHYRIRTLDNGGYWIAESTIFRTLHEFIEYYKLKKGLCCLLDKPCVDEAGKPIISGLNHTDKWEINRSSIAIKRLLGSGQFGDVYEGVWNSKIPVAVKTLKVESMEVQEFLSEAQFMKSLRHKNLVQLYAVCTVGHPIYIITELMKVGSLLNYLRGSGVNLLFKQLIDIAVQVASGMAFLESHNYIHRDLAARNILVGENNIVKVADFGLARIIKEDEYVARMGAKFPIKWTAPESVNFSKFSIKSDVWSFGVLLTEIVTYGRNPYQGMTNNEVINRIENDYRMPCPLNCPTYLYDIMLECWNYEPARRPTFETLQWRLEEFFSSDTDYKDFNETPATPSRKKKNMLKN